MADFRLSAFADEAAESLEGQIEALKRNHIKWIELRNVNGKCVIDYSEDEWLAFKQKLTENEISVSAIGSPIGKYPITDPFEPHFERFKKSVKAAQFFETKRIRMFSFFIPKGEDASKYRDEVLSRLDVFTTYAKQKGIFCYHENEKEIYGDIATRVLDLHRNNDDLKGIFDPANYIQCKQDPKAIVDMLLPYMDYVHIKDAIMQDGSVVPAGKGDGSIAFLLEKFYQPNVNRILTIEPHLTVFAGLNQLQDEKLKHKYTYASQEEAFDSAVQALTELLEQRGYSYE